MVVNPEPEIPQTPGTSVLPMRTSLINYGKAFTHSTNIFWVTTLFQAQAYAQWMFSELNSIAYDRENKC